MGRTTRIASFNLKNLVRAGVPFHDGERYGEADYARKVAWVRGQVERLDADVIGFQEVFHADGLEDAFAGYREGGPGWTLHVPHVGENEPTGEMAFRARSPRCAIASRRPIRFAPSLTKFPDDPAFRFLFKAALDKQLRGKPVDNPDEVGTFSRPVLKAYVELDRGVEAILLVAHLKSKRPVIETGAERDLKWLAAGQAVSLVRRAAEAAALRHHVIEMRRSERLPVILTGDLNDIVPSVTNEIAAGEQWLGSEVGDDEVAMAAFVDHYRLWSVHELFARRTLRDVGYTYIHEGRYDSIDHIYVSRELIGGRGTLGRVKYVQYLNDHLVDREEFLKPRKRVPPRDPNRPMHPESDHGQLVATIELFTRPDPLPPAPDGWRYPGAGR